MQTTKSMKVRLLTLTVALVLLTAAAVSAQSWAGKGRLQGQVKGPDGKPVEGAKVIAMKDGVEGEGPEPIFTKKNGRYLLGGLGGGQWTLVFEYEGMMPAEAAVRVNEFGTAANISPQLREIPKEVLENAAADERRDLIDKGNADLAAGRFAEARAAYEEVLGEIDESQHPALLRGIARTHYEEENVDKAIGSLEKALEIAPDDADSLQLMINLLVASGREAEAEPYMARLPEGAKVDTNAVLNLGIQAYNEGDNAKALEHFNRAAKENPDVATVFYYRGLANLGSGNNPEAIADFKKMLELEPGHANAGEAQQFLEYLESQE